MSVCSARRTDVAVVPDRLILHLPAAPAAQTIFGSAEHSSGPSVQVAKQLLRLAGRSMMSGNGTCFEQRTEEAISVVLYFLCFNSICRGVKSLSSATCAKALRRSACQLCLNYHVLSFFFLNTGAAWRSLTVWLSIRRRGRL